MDCEKCLCTKGCERPHYLFLNCERCEDCEYPVTDCSEFTTKEEEISYSQKFK